MSEWISVEDRLPKVDDYYLAVFDNRDIGGTLVHVNTVMFTNGVFWNDCWSGTVTHWQPLPPPPGDAES